MDAATVLAAIAGAFLLAGFVKGVIGLGLPTVSVGLLGLLMTPAQAAAILVVPSLVTNVWQAAVGGGLWRAGATIVAAARRNLRWDCSSAWCSCRMMTMVARPCGWDWRWRSMPCSVW